MARSSKKKAKENTAFLYERISRDDNLDGDSYSIANQKKLLTKVAKEIKKARAELEKHSGQAMTTDAFIAIVRKYTRARKLTPRMLNELIQRIEVHQAEKLDGVQVQRLTIYYNCIGSLDIPEDVPLDTPKVIMQTRKGVRVAYEPAAVSA